MTLEESRQKILTSVEAVCDAAIERDLLGVLGHGAQLHDALRVFVGSDGDRIGQKSKAFFEKLDSDPSFGPWLFDLMKTARSLLGPEASGGEQR